MKKKQAVRKVFRDACLKRDGYKCVTCGYKGWDEELEVHHITDKSLLAEEFKYIPENGISVCNPCHQKAEQFHISGGKTWVEGYHPDDLYKLIGSRWSLATIEQYTL
jgi:5-methylcytosine-specific restriction endonuclease McrA